MTEKDTKLFFDNFLGDVLKKHTIESLLNPNWLTNICEPMGANKIESLISNGYLTKVGDVFHSKLKKRRTYTVKIGALGRKALKQKISHYIK